MVNVYGRDPATGFARRTLDNVGVQYGLKALQERRLHVDRFLDLNEKIGGYDNDGNVRAARSVADPFRSGHGLPHRPREPGRGSLPDVPILDLRPYSDNVHRHPHLHPLVHHARASPRGSRLCGQPGDVASRRWRHGTDDRRGALADGGLAGCDRGRRLRPPAVREGGGGEAGDPRGRLLDRAGDRIDDPAEVDATGPCTTLYPPASTPRLRAGAPLDSMALKCQLRPAERERLPGAHADPGGQAARGLPRRRLRLHAAGSASSPFREPGCRSDPELRGALRPAQRLARLVREPAHQFARRQLGPPARTPARPTGGSRPRRRARARPRAAARSGGAPPDSRGGASASCSRMKRFSIPRAVRPVNARVSAVGAALAQRVAVRRRRGRLGREHERGAELRRGRAGGQHGGDAAAGGDAAGGDERAGRSRRARAGAARAGRCRRAPRRRRSRGGRPPRRPAPPARRRPPRRRRRASAGVVTVTQTAQPAACSASTSAAAGQPNVNETTGTRSSATSASFSSQPSSS